MPRTQRPRTLTAVIAAGLIAANLTVGCNIAEAAKAKCGAVGNFYAGATSAFATSTYGVRADVETNRPALCNASGGSPSVSSAWVMLLPNNAAYYAQAGYAKVGLGNSQYNNGFHYLAQYKTPSGSRPTFISGDPGTTTHTYAVYLRASDDRIHMTRDGVNLLTLNYDTTGTWSTSWGGEFSGEAFHKQSDVPGTATDRTRFNYIQRYLGNGGIDFVTTLNGFTQPSSRYHRHKGAAQVGGQYLDVWTDPL